MQENLFATMQTIFILSGPQAIGKTRNAIELANLLRCEYLVDEWNGRSVLRPGTLAVTNGEHVMPSGAVAFEVEDEAGIDALLAALRALLLANPIRLPYSSSFLPCSCGSETKDGCVCKRATILSNTASAISGVA